MSSLREAERDSRLFVLLTIAAIGIPSSCSALLILTPASGPILDPEAAGFEGWKVSPHTPNPAEVGFSRAHLLLNTGLVGASAASGLEVTTLRPGSSPEGVAVDAANDSIFVTNFGSGNLTVIAGSSNRVVHSISVGTVGTEPYGILYDPSHDRVYVTDYASTNLFVFNATSYQLVGAITVGGGGSGLAIDPVNDLVFVPNPGLGTVTVLNGSTSKVVTTTSVGSTPMAAAFDISNGEVYVSNYGSASVTILNGSTGSSVKTVPVGLGPTGVAVDVKRGLAYVANSGGTNLTVINDSTNKVVGSVQVGTSPATVTVAGPSGFIYVSNFGSNNLSMVNSTTRAVVGALPIGQGPLGSAFNLKNGCLYVADSGSNQVSAVAKKLAVSGTLSMNRTDAGVGVIFGASVKDGLPPLGSYHWAFGDGTSANFTQNTSSHAYAAAGNYTASVSVVDGGGFSSSGNVSLIVNRAPVVSDPRPSLNSADIGQSVTFRTSPSLGTPPYVRFFWLGLPGNCSTNTTTPIVACNVTVAALLSITVSTKDSIGVTSQRSNPLAFRVFAMPQVSMPTANRTVGYVGEAVTFQGNATLGSGNFTFSWNGLPLGCTLSGSGASCALVRIGIFRIAVSATDGNGVSSSESPPLDFVVYAPVGLVLNLSQPQVDSGQPVTLTARAYGGTGNYTYSWIGLPGGCAPPSGPILRCSVTAPGGYRIQVTAVDANNFASTPVTVLLHVYPPLLGSIGRTTTNGTSGRSVALTAIARGGSGSYSFAWSFGDGTAARGANQSHVFIRSGVYSVQVWINDSLGSSALETLRLTVTDQPVGNTTFLGLPDDSGYFLIGAGAALSVTALVLFLFRRSKGQLRADRRSLSPNKRKLSKPRRR